MQDNNFVSYEYKTVTTKAKDQTRMTDMYEAFGWEVTGTSVSFGSVTLSLRRDRKQKHRSELSKLERQAEQTLDSLGGLRRSQTLGAKVFAYLFGIVAALVLGGGMCLVMLIENSVPALVGGIVLGVIGIALCCVNYFIYQKLAQKRAKQVLPAIDQTEEKLANLLEQGNDLLHADLI